MLPGVQFRLVRVSEVIQRLTGNSKYANSEIPNRMSILLIFTKFSQVSMSGKEGAGGMNAGSSR